MAKIIHKDTQVFGACYPGTSTTVDGSSAIDLDWHTNAATLCDAHANPSAYSVIDGVLMHDGSPVAIADWCDDCKTLDSLDSATTVAQLKKVLLLMRDKPGFTKG